MANLVCPRNQEKGAVIPQETEPDLPVSVQETLAEVWVGGGLLQGWGTECSSACMGPFEGGPHYLHCLHHSLASGQTTGGNTARLITKNWIKDLPPIRTKPSFPLSQSFTSGSFHKLLILLHQRADRMKTTITEN